MHIQQIGYSGLLEGLYHSQSNAAKAGGADEQEKKRLLGKVLRFQRECPPRLADVRHCWVGTGLHVTDLVIFNASVNERRLVGRLCGMLRF